MRKTVDILGVSIDCVTMHQAVETVKGFLLEDRVHTIYTPNAEILMCAQRDSHLKSILNQSDLVVADGAGVVLAARILGLDLPEKVSGIDLVKNSLFMDAGRKVRYYLFGSKPGVAEAAAENMLKASSRIEIAGCSHGYHPPEKEKEIIDLINSTNADILLVALGAPKQEKWIHEHKKDLNVRVCMGVGGSLDVLSGRTKPTPEFLRRHGLEWLHRLYKEPWRYKRMMDLPRFMLRVLAAKAGKYKS